ncbi:translation initiation factor 2 [Pseudomonas huanghezhanensis]|uniref:translation initiation factor 2 n=1 Tax=Pseudomonas huanghezhanensis TaxID=3002903 RepID=UPI002285BBB5|nr:translation initiation factor 2 [Pseudomonas sp. BSw22131]
MRPVSWCLVLTLLASSVMSLSAEGEEAADSTSQNLALPSTATQLNDLRQKLADSERQRQTLVSQLQAASAEQQTIVLSRLRQENQRLKLQLKESQSVMPLRVLTEQQQWFVAGGGVALIALLCGIFASGWRRQRRQWLN